MMCWRQTPSIAYKSDYRAWKDLEAIMPHGSSIKLTVCEGTNCRQCIDSFPRNQSCPYCGMPIMQPSGRYTTNRYAYNCVCGTALLVCYTSDRLLLVGYSVLCDDDVI